MFEICRNPLAFPLRIVYNQRSETQKAGLLPADVESEGADMAEDKKKASDKAKDSQTDNKHKALEAALAQIEKNYGKGDFRIYKYTKKDYVRSEKIKTSSGKETNLIRVENVKNITEYIDRIDEMIERKEALFEKD